MSISAHSKINRKYWTYFNFNMENKYVYAFFILNYWNKCNLSCKIYAIIIVYLIFQFDIIFFGLKFSF